MYTPQDSINQDDANYEYDVSSAFCRVGNHDVCQRHQKFEPSTNLDRVMIERNCKCASCGCSCHK